MSKNMTRKGLAFGAGLSLVVSGFAALPAQANGLTGFISLLPTTGPETALAITAGVGQDFSLTASPASTVGSSGNLKFLVTDPEAKFEPYIGGLSDDGVVIEYPDSSASLLESDPAETVAVASDGKVTVTTAHSFVAGDRVEFSLDVVTDSGMTVLEDDTIYVVDSVTGTTSFTLAAGSAKAYSAALGTGNVDITSNVATLTVSNVFGVGDTFSINADIVTGANTILPVSGSPYTVAANTTSSVVKVSRSASNVAQGAATTGVTLTRVTVATAGIDVSGAGTTVDIRKVRSATNSSGQYVVDSGVSNGSAIALDLRQVDAVSRSVTVQAWVDTFSDNKIGATEYVSAPVTISFVAMADITATTSLTPPAAGDATLSARVTTSPLINLLQDENSDLVEIVFTRQGSVTKGLTTAASQDATTGVISGSITMAIAADNITSWVDSDGDGTGVETGSSEWSDAAGILAVPTAKAAAQIGAVSVTAGKVASVTTTVDHNLRTGDKITYASADITVMDETAATVTVTGARTFTYPLSETAAVTAASDADETNGGYTIVTNGAGVSLVERVFAGDYSAQAALETSANNYKLIGAASAFGTQALAADDIVFTTVASASVQGVRINNDADDTDTDVRIKAGTLTATVTATVVDDEGDALGAGRRVDWTMEVGAFTTIKVNDRTSGTANVTDANGQVTFVVTDTTGADGKKITIKATPEGVAAAATWITLEWDTPSFSLVDLNTTSSEIGGATGDQTEVRHVAAGTTYNVALLVADQWYTPATDADYRILVSGAGVTEGIVTPASGKATVAVRDSGVSTNFNSVLTLQKKSTTGTWSKVVAKTINTKVNASNDLLLAADASTLYGGATADLADLVAEKALLELDSRQAAGIKPEYENFVTLTGKAVSKTTGVSLPGSVVTVSGATNVLFEQGALNVAKRGSLTFLADATTGEFAINLYSTTTQTDTVITITANGVSKTVKVTFTGIGVGEGTKLDVTTPANVKPASTFQVKAKLSDAFGNGVEATAGRVKVTYTGAGIVFGTLPDKTDKNGELMFSVLLGSNDTGNVVVTVSYDQNGDADYVDAKDLNTTKTITVGTGAAAGAGKVNVGSFNGKLVVYASGLSGKTISWKVGGKWGKAVASSNYAVFNRPTPVAGATVSVDIYVDGVKTLTKSVVTR